MDADNDNPKRVQLRFAEDIGVAQLTQACGRLFASADREQGTAAFVEKRDARFRNP